VNSVVRDYFEVEGQYFVLVVSDYWNKSLSVVGNPRTSDDASVLLIGHMSPLHRVDWLDHVILDMTLSTIKADL
jgi:hypothetical protein